MFLLSSAFNSIILSSGDLFYSIMNTSDLADRLSKITVVYILPPNDYLASSEMSICRSSRVCILIC